MGKGREEPSLEQESRLERLVVKFQLPRGRDLR